MPAIEIWPPKAAAAGCTADVELVTTGTGSPLTDNLSGWQIVAKDKKKFTVTAVRILSKPNPSHERLLLRGLDAATLYRDLDSGECFSGAFLMNVGIYCPIVKGDFVSFRRRFRAERGGNGC